MEVDIHQCQQNDFHGKMAIYANPSNAQSFDSVSIDRDTTENGRVILDMDTNSEQSTKEKVNIFIIFTFILELLILIFVIVLEYFLRYSDVFPVRRQNFSCTDPLLSSAIKDQSYSEFIFTADIPTELILALSFSIPPIVIIIGEIGLWAFSNEHQKVVRAMCHTCKIPQIVRRLLRFVGVFLFGLLMTLVFTDVTKMLVGRLRPTFLQVCLPNMTLCRSGASNGDGVCTQSDKGAIRQARLSFPSAHASVTSFAAVFIAIYIHGAIRTHAIKILRPFLALAFIMMSLLCGLARVGRNASYWTDVAAGFVYGTVLAIYMGVFVLNNFRENISGRLICRQLKDYLIENHRNPPDPKDYYKEPDKYDQWNYFGGPTYQNTSSFNYGIPRARATKPNRERERERNQEPKPPKQQHNTFQRDLQRTIDQYRRGSQEEDDAWE